MINSALLMKIRVNERMLSKPSYSPYNDDRKGFPLLRRPSGSRGFVFSPCFCAGAANVLNHSVIVVDSWIVVVDWGGLESIFIVLAVYAF